MSKPTIIIGCKMLEKELCNVLSTDSETDIIWLEAALHCNLNRMGEELKKALSKADESNGRVRLLYGTGCHPDLANLINEHDARTLKEKNCIEALLGKRVEELERSRTVIMTPAWVRAWPSIMKALGWDEVDVRMNLGRYERILVVDAGMDSLSDDEVLSFFDLTQLPIEIEPIDLDHFKRVVFSLIE